MDDDVPLTRIRGEQFKGGPEANVPNGILVSREWEIIDQDGQKVNGD